MDELLELLSTISSKSLSQSYVLAQTGSIKKKTGEFSPSPEYILKVTHPIAYLPDFWGQARRVSYFSSIPG